MTSRQISYFGYGSLVNRDTRPDAEQATNVVLNGWQRVWNHRVSQNDSRHPCTSLSIEPAEGFIEGVLVQIAECDLPVLDQREYGYERIRLAATDFVIPENLDVQEVYVYRSLAHNRHLADEHHPVVQSYVDCVMAGYLKRFEEDGLQRFLHSTRGWDRPLLKDRHAPTYPRHVPLPAQHHARFDDLLAPVRKS